VLPHCARRATCRISRVAIAGDTGALLPATKPCRHLPHLPAPPAPPQRAAPAAAPAAPVFIHGLVPTMFGGNTLPIQPHGSGNDARGSHGFLHTLTMHCYRARRLQHLQLLPAHISRLPIFSSLPNPCTLQPPRRLARRLFNVARIPHHAHAHAACLRSTAIAQRHYLPTSAPHRTSSTGCTYTRDTLARAWFGCA